MQRGVLIAFEGTDGSGKSTLSENIDRYLRSRNIPTCYVQIATMPEDSIVTKIRQITRNVSSETMSPATETLLYLASVSQRASTFIRPALERGEVVLADRFTLSVLTLAHYARNQSRDFVRQMINFAVGDMQADLTIVCDVDSVTAMSRVLQRKVQDGRSPSRKEQEGSSLLQVLRDGLLSEAKLQSNNMVVLSSVDLDVDQMKEQTIAILRQRFAERFSLLT